jgi:mannitol-1-/sugar-/sorbitol-6-phosphatase
MTGYDAVLCDMDGVLLDSTALLIGVWGAWAKAHGLDPATVIAQTHGRRSGDTLRAVAPELDPEQESRELDRLVLAGIDGIPAIDGAAEFLAGLPVPWALVTSGTGWFARRCLAAAGLPAPPAAVYSEDVPRGKPHPDPYLAGAALLGVPPERCLVVEDAPHGIAAAKAAGCTVIAVTTTHHAADLTAADTHRPTLAAAGVLIAGLTARGEDRT